MCTYQNYWNKVSLIKSKSKKNKKIDSIGIGLASPEEIRRWGERRLPNGTLLGQVEKDHTVDYESLKPIEGGLFCERIFGPVEDFYCSCERRGEKNEKFCPTCEVEFTKSRVRRTRMGYIPLAVPVAHVWYLRGRPSYIANLIGKSRNAVDRLAYGETLCESFIGNTNSTYSNFFQHSDTNLVKSEQSSSLTKGMDTLNFGKNTTSFFVSPKPGSNVRNVPEVCSTFKGITAQIPTLHTSQHYIPQTTSASQTSSPASQALTTFDGMGEASKMVLKVRGNNDKGPPIPPYHQRWYGVLERGVVYQQYPLFNITVKRRTPLKVQRGLLTHRVCWWFSKFQRRYTKEVLQFINYNFRWSAKRDTSLINAKNKVVKQGMKSVLRSRGGTEIAYLVRNLSSFHSEGKQNWNSFIHQLRISSFFSRKFAQSTTNEKTSFFCELYKYNSFLDQKTENNLSTKWIDCISLSTSAINSSLIKNTRNKHFVKPCFTNRKIAFFSSMNPMLKSGAFIPTNSVQNVRSWRTKVYGASKGVLRNISTTASQATSTTFDGTGGLRSCGGTSGMGVWEKQRGVTSLINPLMNRIRVDNRLVKVTIFSLCLSKRSKGVVRKTSRISLQPKVFSLSLTKNIQFTNEIYRFFIDSIIGSSHSSPIIAGSLSAQHYIPQTTPLSFATLQPPTVVSKPSYVPPLVVRWDGGIGEAHTTINTSTTSTSQAIEGVNGAPPIPPSGVKVAKHNGVCTADATPPHSFKKLPLPQAPQLRKPSKVEWGTTALEKQTAGACEKVIAGGKYNKFHSLPLFSTFVYKEWSHRFSFLEYFIWSARSDDLTLPFYVHQQKVNSSRASRKNSLNFVKNKILSRSASFSCCSLPTLHTEALRNGVAIPKVTSISTTTSTLPNLYTKGNVQQAPHVPLASQAHTTKGGKGVWEKHLSITEGIASPPRPLSPFGGMGETPYRICNAEVGMMVCGNDNNDGNKTVRCTFFHPKRGFFVNQKRSEERLTSVLRISNKEREEHTTSFLFYKLKKKYSPHTVTLQTTNHFCINESIATPHFLKPLTTPFPKARFATQTFTTSASQAPKVVRGMGLRSWGLGDCYTFGNAEVQQATENGNKVKSWSETGDNNSIDKAINFVENSTTFGDNALSPQNKLWGKIDDTQQFPRLAELLSFTGGTALRSLLSRFDFILLGKFLRYELKNLEFKVNSLLALKILTYSQGLLLGKLAKRRSKQIRRLKLLELFQFQKSNPGWMILSVLPVLPPDLRPILRVNDDFVVASDLNRLYQTVLRRNNTIRERLDDPLPCPESGLFRQRSLQKAVDGLLENGKGGGTPLCASKRRPLVSLSHVLKGKKGLFRQHLLGKRVDYSGRSVIVVGPKLGLHECGLPKEMAMELFQPFLLNRLKVKGLAYSNTVARQMIKQEDPVIWHILKQLVYEHPVLLNRAPTLHRLGIQAFQPRLVSGRAILLHPLVCNGFNADFDGDQMAVHIPLSFQARAEAWKILWSKNNFLSPATGQPILMPSQDMVLGCYYLSVSVPRVLGFINEVDRFLTPFVPTVENPLTISSPALPQTTTALHLLRKPEHYIHTPSALHLIPKVSKPEGAPPFQGRGVQQAPKVVWGKQHTYQRYVSKPRTINTIFDSKDTCLPVPPKVVSGYAEALWQALLAIPKEEMLVRYSKNQCLQSFNLFHVKSWPKKTSYKFPVFLNSIKTLTRGKSSKLFSLSRKKNLFRYTRDAQVVTQLLFFPKKRFASFSFFTSVYFEGLAVPPSITTFGSTASNRKWCVACLPSVSVLPELGKVKKWYNKFQESQEKDSFTDTTKKIVNNSYSNNKNKEHYFSNLQDSLIAYFQGRLQTHTPFWVRVDFLVQNKILRTKSDLEEKLELIELENSSFIDSSTNIQALTTEGGMGLQTMIEADDKLPSFIEMASFEKKPKDTTVEHQLWPILQPRYGSSQKVCNILFQNFHKTFKGFTNITNIIVESNDTLESPLELRLSADGNLIKISPTFQNHYSYNATILDQCNEKSIRYMRTTAGRVVINKALF